MNATEQLLLKGQPVVIVADDSRGQCWIRTQAGLEIKVFRSGLSVASDTAVAIAGLKVDTSRGTDGAR